MDFFFADALGLGGPSKGPEKTDYEKLSDLCTALVIAEEGSLVPLEPVGDLLLTTLKRADTQGDVHVMVARALALILDKFSFSFKVFKKKNMQAVTECLQHVFSLVAKRTSTLQFEQTTRAELIEELLRCLTHGCCSPLAVVQKMMPPVEVQLTFCESAIDGSKWASCKVLQHCTLLTRRGLETAHTQSRVEELLRRHLELLTQLEMDYEWDELLRTVVDGIVMIRTWNASRSDSANEGTPTLARRRAKSPSPATPRATVATCFLALCERVCSSHTALARKELVLACTALTLTATELFRDTTEHARRELLSCVIPLLGTDADASLEFSNPFSIKGTITSDENEADDAFKALPNLQWLVPSLPWSALLLVAKALGAEPPVRGAYVWAWRGEGDAFYWYRHRERELMTQALFKQQRTVSLKSGTHKADLVLLLDHNVRTEMTTRIHFQPIPCALTYDGTRLPHCAGGQPRAIGTDDASECAADENLLRCLRALSFGHTAIATFAKAVQLYVMCTAGPAVLPDACEAVLRMYAVDHDGATVESLAKALLHRSAAWAPVLMAAGVAEAIERASSLGAAATAVPKLAASTPSAATRKRRRSVSPSPALPHARRSPIASLIREGTSGGGIPSTSPAVVPMRLPPHTSIPELLMHGSATELAHVLRVVAGEDAGSEGVTPQWAALPPARITEAIEHVDLGSAAAERLSAAVTVYTLKALSAHAIAGRQRPPLLKRLEQCERPFIVSICPPHSHNEASGQASSAACCPSGHALHIHFSTNWQCNVCHEMTAFGAWSCRVCNYDLCYRCAERVLHRLEVNATACVRDVAQAWMQRTRTASETTGGNDEDAATMDDALVHAQHVFTRHRVLAAALPASILRTTTAHSVHMGPTLGPCPCGVTCPDGVLAGHEQESEALGAAYRSDPADPIHVLLTRFGNGVAQDPATCRAIVEVLETHAADIFLSGTAGLPRSLQRLLKGLSAHLPLDLKRRAAHFLTIGCRRFALQHIQDNGNVPLRGSVMGEVDSNGVAFRITVPRASSDKIDFLTQLHAGFCRQIPLRNKVEYRFSGEEGTGSGPTQELYTELSSYFADQSELWCQSDEGGRIPFPNCDRLYVRDWFVLGAACARAFIDDYQIHVDLMPAAWHLIQAAPSLEEPDQVSGALLWSVFSEVQPVVAQSLEKLRTDCHTDADLASLGLEDEAGCTLTLASREAYIARHARSYLSVGLQNLRGFVMGLLTSIDLDAFFFFSPEELTKVLCGGCEVTDQPLFTEDELRAVTIGAHGYSTGCREVEMFISIVGNLDRSRQAYFVEFLTGSVYLPPNGLKGLKGKITVVRKDLEGRGEQTLPSCNTCFLYLKLPPYSSSDIMARRLLVAIEDGRKNFSLS